jgi:predicted DNA-binding transcriptional regulator AlpA
VVEAIVPQLVSQPELTLYPVQWGKAATVARMLNCSRSCVFRMVADGRLPRPKKLGARLSLWNLQEISERVAAEPLSLPRPAPARPAQRTPAAPKRRAMHR